MVCLSCSSPRMSLPLFLQNYVFCCLLWHWSPYSVVWFSLYCYFFFLHILQLLYWSCVCPSSEWFFHWGGSRTYCDLKSLSFNWFSYTWSIVLVTQINNSRYYLVSFIMVCKHKQSHLLIHQKSMEILWSSASYSQGRTNVILFLK